MEQNNEQKPVKVAAQRASSHGNLRVTRETKKKVFQELGKINRKDFGRRVRPADYIALAITRITPADYKILQEGSMSGEDRIKLQHKEYVAKFGPISWGDYLWKRTNGEISASSGVDSSLNSKDPSSVSIHKEVTNASK